MVSTWMGDHLGKLSCCWKRSWLGPVGGDLPSGRKIYPMSECSDRDTVLLEIESWGFLGVLAKVPTWLIKSAPLIILSSNWLIHSSHSLPQAALRSSSPITYPHLFPLRGIPAAILSAVPVLHKTLVNFRSPLQRPRVSSKH